MFDEQFNELCKRIEDETGFTCYETSPGSQVTFFGTSSQFEAFKTLIGTQARTGTIAYTMDDGEQYMFSEFDERWY